MTCGFLARGFSRCSEQVREPSAYTSLLMFSLLRAIQAIGMLLSAAG